MPARRSWRTKSAASAARHDLSLQALLVGRAPIFLEHDRNIRMVSDSATGKPRTGSRQSHKSASQRALSTFRPMMRGWPRDRLELCDAPPGLAEQQQFGEPLGASYADSARPLEEMYKRQWCVRGCAGGGPSAGRLADRCSPSLRSLDARSRPGRIPLRRPVLQRCRMTWASFGSFLSHELSRASRLATAIRTPSRGVPGQQFAADGSRRSARRRSRTAG